MENKRKIEILKLIRRFGNTFSKANKKKVAACITTADGMEILGYGVNHTEINNKILDYCEDKSGKTLDFVIHSEHKAIIEMLKNNSINQIEPNSLIMFCTYSPCWNCCKLMVSTGLFSKLIYIDKHPFNFDFEYNTNDDRILTCKSYLEKNNIEVEHIEFVNNSNKEK